MIPLILLQETFEAKDSFPLPQRHSSRSYCLTSQRDLWNFFFSFVVLYQILIFWPKIGVTQFRNLVSLDTSKLTLTICQLNIDSAILCKSAEYVLFLFRMKTWSPPNYGQRHSDTPRTNKELKNDKSLSLFRAKLLALHSQVSIMQFILPISNVNSSTSE